MRREKAAAIENFTKENFTCPFVFACVCVCFVSSFYKFCCSRISIFSFVFSC